MSVPDFLTVSRPASLCWLREPDISGRHVGLVDSHVAQLGEDAQDSFPAFAKLPLGYFNQFGVHDNNALTYFSCYLRDDANDRKWREFRRRANGAGLHHSRRSSTRPASLRCGGHHGAGRRPDPLSIPSSRRRVRRSATHARGSTVAPTSVAITNGNIPTGYIGDNRPCVEKSTPHTAGRHVWQSLTAICHTQRATCESSE